MCVQNYCLLYVQNISCSKVYYGSTLVYWVTSRFAMVILWCFDIVQTVLEGLGWLRGSSMGVCEALCDMLACKRAIQINLIWFDPCRSKDMGKHISDYNFQQQTEPNSIQLCVLCNSHCITVGYIFSVRLRLPVIGLFKSCDITLLFFLLTVST